MVFCKLNLKFMKVMPLVMPIESKEDSLVTSTTIGVFEEQAWLPEAFSMSEQAICCRSR